MGYVTKNSFKIGFFVNSSLNPSPSFFCSAREPESAFLPTEQLPQLGALIEKNHRLSKKYFCIFGKSTLAEAVKSLQKNQPTGQFSTAMS
jgi:hypothetical protein